MASTYDFQNLKRKLDTLEKKYSSFVGKKDSIISSAKNIKFDDNKYGKYAIERRVGAIVNDEKKQLDSYYDSSIKAIDRKVFTSKEKIKDRAREVNELILSLNDTINNVQLLNDYFMQRDYLMVISFINTHQIKTADNSDFIEYLKLLKTESMDKQCELYLSIFTGQDANFFSDYVNECKNISAKSHLPLALAKAIIYYSKLVEANFDSDKNIAYKYAKIGLNYYVEADDVIKHDCKNTYKYMYDSFVVLYNDLSKKPYEAFDYANVMSFLLDSVLLNKEDISNEFYKTQDNSLCSHFQYITDKYEVADKANLDLAITDTIGMVKTNQQQEYYQFWLKNIEKFTWVVVKMIFDKQELLLSKKEILMSGILVSDCISSLSLSPDLFVKTTFNVASYYYSFVMENKKEIYLIAFLKLLIKINGLFESYKGKGSSDEINNELIKLQKQFASIAYATIKNNLKYCAALDANMIKTTSELYIQSAKTIGVKVHKKDILSSTKSKPISEDIIVSILTTEEQNAKKKAWIIGGSIAAVLIVVTVVLVVLLT